MVLHPERFFVRSGSFHKRPRTRYRPQNKPQPPVNSSLIPNITQKVQEVGIPAVDARHTKKLDPLCSASPNLPTEGREITRLLGEVSIQEGSEAAPSPVSLIHIHAVFDQVDSGP